MHHHLVRLIAKLYKTTVSKGNAMAAMAAKAAAVLIVSPTLQMVSLPVSAANMFT